MREPWLRAGLALLAASAAVVGFWALLAPRSFYDDFPGGGRSWVSALPPYNEHLVRDVGGLNLALVLLLAWAAASLDRRLVTVGLLAYLVNAVPHFVFHVTELGSLATVDQIGETFSLAVALVLPVVLLAPALRLPAARDGA